MNVSKAFNKNAINKLFRNEWKKQIDNDTETRKIFKAFCEEAKFWVKSLTFFFYFKGFIAGHKEGRMEALKGLVRMLNSGQPRSSYSEKLIKDYVNTELEKARE